jgi:hypothetical protein
MAIISLTHGKMESMSPTLRFPHLGALLSALLNPLPEADANDGPVPKEAFRTHSVAQPHKR